MRFFIVAMALLGFSVAVSAGTAYHPAGSSLTLGAVSYGNRLLSQINNPASSAYAMEYRGRRWNIGLLSSAGVGVEFGDVDDLFNELDRVSNELQRVGIDPFVEGPALEAELNVLLVQLGDKGYFNVSAEMHAPGMPLVLKLSQDGGTLFFDVSETIQGKFGILDAAVTFDLPSQSLLTNAALYVKGSDFVEYAFGYSRKIMDTPFGKLYGGAKAKYYQVALTKSIVGLAEANGDVENTTDNLFDVGFSQNSAFAVDAGAMLVAKNYLLGASWTNINEPTFDYAPIGTNCGSLSGVDLTRCNLAATFSNEIPLNETHKLNTQLRLDASLHTANKRWAVMGSLDSNPVDDPVGNELQWFVLSGAYMNPNRIIPSFRAGYRKNLVGTGLTYATAGISLFRVLHLDMAYSLDTVLDETGDIPRSFFFNVGLELGL